MTGPVETLAQAVYSFCETEHVYVNEIDIVHFAQSWPNTACAFDVRLSVAGQAITSAWMTIITRGDRIVVFCNGRAAYYTADRAGSTKLLEDVRAGHVASQHAAVLRYKAILI